MDALAEITQLRSENLALKANLEHLQHQLDQLRRLVFGHKTERIDTLAGSMTLPLFDEPEPMPVTPEAETTLVPAHTRKKPARKTLPEHLPRVVEVIDLDEADKACPCCGEMRHPIGDAVSEKLDYVPAQLNVLQYRRPKYACKQCEGQIACAPLPPQPIDQGMAAPGLLAHIIVSKFADHLPLNRQTGMLKRHGIELSPSTLGDWVLACGELLRPLQQRMAELARSSDILHTDDTIFPLAQKGGCKQARVWLYHDPKQKLAIYDFTENRKGQHAADWLEGWSGYLIADAYGGYDRLFTGKPEGKAIYEVGCWAHARRKFYDIAKTAPKRGLAHEAMEWIARLFHLDNAHSKEQPEERKRRRDAENRPLLADFHVWLTQNQAQLLPKSPLSQAIGYALNQWDALTRHLEDGRLPLENNAAERGLRPVAVGRKNWLFTGSVRGGQAAAVLLSLVQSARLCGLNPYAYLKDILTRYPAVKAHELDDLLPHRWKAR